MGDYSCGRGIKLQLANGVGLAIRFIIASDVLRSNSSEVFPEIKLWWRSPHWHRPEDFGVYCLKSPMAG
jgi:hypothetical protein